MMIIDRIEGKTVVIEDGDRYFADKNATKKRREDIIKLQNSLWE